jgi:hypothetical protein
MKSALGVLPTEKYKKHNLWFILLYETLKMYFFERSGWRGRWGNI